MTHHDLKASAEPCQACDEAVYLNEPPYWKTPTELFWHDGCQPDTLSSP